MKFFEKRSAKAEAQKTEAILKLFDETKAQVKDEANERYLASLAEWLDQWHSETGPASREALFEVLAQAAAFIAVRAELDMRACEQSVAEAFQYALAAVASEK